MEPLILILAAAGGWTFDDFCGTPPRPWPGPGPWWWVRKGLAAIGGVVAYIVFADGATDALTTVVVGGVGGVVLASLAAGAGLGAGRAGDVAR
jgi:hypothetical protein